MYSGGEGLFMRGEAPVSPTRVSTSQQVPRRRRVRPYFVAVVVVLALTIILISLFTCFFIPEAEVEITASTLRSGDELSDNFIWVVVDVGLYNPSWSRRITVWAEITDKPTQVSYSKTQSVYIGFKESKDVTLGFTLDSRISRGEFAHRVWLTYPSSRD